MRRSGTRRIVPVILIMIVAILAIAALVSLGRTFFSGGTSTPTKTIVNVGKNALTGSLTSQSVRMLVRGQITANENFHSYSIMVSNDMRNMTTYMGYLNQQVDNEQLSNNTQAYTQLVYALSHAQMMDGSPLQGDANDTRGICATGEVYEFDVLQDNKSVQSLWTSSCSGSPGSLKANLGQISSLFQLQIPNFSELLSRINLS